MFSSWCRQPASVHLEFAPPWVRVLRRSQWGLLGLMLLAWGVAAWCWWEARRAEADVAAYQRATARIEQLIATFQEAMRRDGLVLATEQAEGIRRQVAFMNQLANKRAFSWVQLLHDLGEGVPPHVSIDSVRLNFQDSTIQLRGTVRSLADLKTMVTQLEQHAAFAQVALNDHQQVQGTTDRTTKGTPDGAIQSRREEPVSFSLRMNYQRPR